MASHEAAAPPASVDDALEDVAMRFLANLPVEEKAAFFAERLFFQLQQAHWFYEDFFVDDLDHIPHMRFREFTTAMFERCSLLEEYTAKHDDFMDLFKEYSASIPSFGAFVLNPSMTKVLLVQSYRGKSWGLPKGKINEGETELQCAIREVAEETGVDILPFARAEDFVAYYNGGQLVKMFIARGVPASTKAAPQTRKEIKRADWHDIASIPVRSGVAGASKYWTVRPMMRDLLKWIRRQKGGKRAAKGGGGGGGGDDHAGSRGKHSQAARRKAAKAAGAGLSAAGAPSGSKKSGKRRPRADCAAASGAASGSGSHAATFGEDAGVGWSVADMFRANAELLDVKFRYDGNPQTFGSPSEDAVPLSGAGAPSKKRKGAKGKGSGAKGGGGAATAARRKGRGAAAAASNPPGGSGGGDRTRKRRQRRDSFDADEHEATFGAGSGGGWAAADMFKANAMLGVDFTYDGDPQKFGDVPMGRSALAHTSAPETKSRSRTSDEDEDMAFGGDDAGSQCASPDDEDDERDGDGDGDDDSADDDDDDADSDSGDEDSGDDDGGSPVLDAVPVTSAPADLSPDDPVAGMWAFEPDMDLVMAAFSQALSPKSREYLVQA
ncbi:hypothetical protein FNF29_06203 [Cafeteria roenbergensis]|uniref:Nudix hydrolase domain-containing protein n=1 Tax=Cafeteria roenbergensis TaxID=33653 RepID=A0A5A8D1T1_CAFRO|nr:hypothetical protein FNF29_06203 [Cafeteria roenbergensis]KAA0158724.1 hypothetical protein FNF31_05250 [Cafeteria roenbergensis]|eukprot:KAA0149115.1 hypothetical protein FNF29_06203 [Cafeteria roenbergensis]